MRQIWRYQIWSRRTDGFLLWGCAVFWAGLSIIFLWFTFTDGGGDHAENVLPYVGLSILSAWLGWRAGAGDGAVMLEGRMELRELAFNSWDSLVAKLVNDHHSELIYRGQDAYCWPLGSRLARALQGVAADDWYDRENNALAMFMRLAGAKLHRPPAEKDLLGWWSLMQHYGAPTRLMDWSASPFVGCYFALASPHTEKGNDAGALWLLNKQISRSIYGSPAFFQPDHLGTRRHETYKASNLVAVEYPGEIADWAQAQNDALRQAVREGKPWPLVVVPTSPDQRMIAQQGCFTVDCDLGTTLDQFLPRATWAADRPGQTSVIAPGPVGSPGHSIAKIRVPYAWREQALNSLALMNITPASLFPTIDGLGLATRLAIETGYFGGVNHILGL